MKLVAKIESEIELMYISGKQVVLSDNITKEFDKKLLMILIAEIKLEKQKALDGILEVFNKIYKNPQKYDGYVQIQGATIRVKDFSYFRIKKFDTRVCKR